MKNNLFRLVILVLLNVLVCNAVATDNVSSVRSYQEGKNIIITYELSKQSDIAVSVSTDGGRIYKTLNSVYGDVGNMIKPGSKKIVWDVLSEYESFNFSEVCFKVVPSKEEQTLNNCHDYVDLALSSGTLWATCNVGASKPDDYGNYYAWGENEPKLDYSVQNYSYKEKSTTISITNDVAYKICGKNWRMPNKAEIEELYSECNWEMTTYNNVVGYKVISKKNNNYIFLPAAGFRLGKQLLGRGSLCYYWSSSLFSENLAYGIGCANVSGYYRYDGMPIRPVINK